MFSPVSAVVGLVTEGFCNVILATVVRLRRALYHGTLRWLGQAEASHSRPQILSAVTNFTQACHQTKSRGAGFRQSCYSAKGKV